MLRFSFVHPPSRSSVTLRARAAFLGNRHSARDDRPPAPRSWSIVPLRRGPTTRVDARPCGDSAAAMSPFRSAIVLGLAAAVAAGCAGGPFGALYPARPPATPGEPVVEPAPSKIVLHTTLTAKGMESALDE